MRPKLPRRAAYGPGAGPGAGPGPGPGPGWGDQGVPAEGLSGIYRHLLTFVVTSRINVVEWTVQTASGKPIRLCR